MTTARQEVVKLSATWVNNLSTAIVIAGVIAPAAGFTAALEKGETGNLYIGSSLLWLVGGFLVHVFGRVLLEARYEA